MPCTVVHTLRWHHTDSQSRVCVYGLLLSVNCREAWGLEMRPKQCSANCPCTTFVVTVPVVVLPTASLVTASYQALWNWCPQNLEFMGETQSSALSKILEEAEGPSTFPLDVQVHSPSEMLQGDSPGWVQLSGKGRKLVPHSSLTMDTHSTFK